MHPLFRAVLGFALLAGPAAPSFAAETPRGYHRFPALHGETVVFTSEGDLWRVPVTGGPAQRLTTHPGTEAHAVISPDGATIAFTAEYEGPAEVYTMPLAGGRPVRRTFDGASDTSTAGWTPDGRVLIRTRADSGLPGDQLATLDPLTGERRLLPLAQATEGAFEPGTGTLFFTRFPKQSSSTKRYHGGWAQNLWRFGLDDPEATPLTADFDGTSRNPMWWEGRLYFLSDRDGILNLWSSKPDGTDPRQHTRHRDFDIASASLHRGLVVYQHGADLRLHDLARATDTLIPISLASDFDQQRERWVKKPVEYLTSAHPSPNGDRLVLTARGQVFVAPAEQGRFVEVPRPPDIRYRNARFFPDGKSLYALSDATGELEFWRLSPDGLAPASALTTNGTVFRQSAVPSPDGQWLAWTDKDLKLWLHHVERRETKLVAASRYDDFADLAWSPDSRWLAFVETTTNTFRQIKLLRPADDTRVTVTSDRVDSASPAWSPDGKWLYFLSDRELRSLVASPWGPRQPDPFFTESTRIYQVALTRGLRSPFAPRDELQADDSPKKDADKDKEKDRDQPKDLNPAKEAEPGKERPASDPPSPPAPPAPVPAVKSTDTNAPATDGKAAVARTNSVPEVVIDLDGLATRLHEVPVPAGNFEQLAVTAKHLLWIGRDTGFGSKRNLRQLEITSKDPKPKTLVEDIASFEPTADGKKLLVRKGDEFHFIAADAAAPAKLEDTRVKLDGWTFAIQPREEWRQIFTEAWRMLRDYFYDRGMHGLDWPAIHAKYLPLVDRVTDREELSDVLAGMAGELSTLHIFVRFGDERDGPDQIAGASLGARLTRDPAAGGWRVQHIHRTDPDYPSESSPLRRPGAEVAVGEVLVRINGRPTLPEPDPGVLLRNQAGRQVLLEVRSTNAPETRRVVVQPITPSAAAELRYDEWELTRREKVEELGQGAIGYVHLRAMGTENIAEWARHFYPVFQRQGLIIDVRNNRGGNIDSWILGKLLRKAWFYWQPRIGEPTWNMQYAFRGHVVVLCNEKTASDGEAFAEGFRRLGLGQVIGTRTWGGEIWLSSQRWLVDRGMATAAELGVYGPEGTWLIEGHGVDPDVVVDNLPHATFQGADAQLEAAVKHLQERIARDPRPLPPAPKYPDKSFPPRP